MKEPVVLVAGGGTGGHVFPMVAVAHALRRLSPRVRTIFVGTARGMETRFVPEQGFELELLDVLPMRGAGVSGFVRGAARAARLLPESRALLRRYRPRVVFSVGGYAAGPITLAARTMGIPVALMEPNSVAGLANLLIAPFVQRAYTAFDLAERHFAPEVVLATGVPLRAGFEPRPYQLSSPVRILVLGGSQGAKSLNETIPEALGLVKEAVSVTHQCGSAHFDAVEARYRTLGASFARVTPFIDDMPRALADADLVVSRSGAGAVSEITAIGRPSLLVPYPFASGDHQRQNALSMERAGASVCVPNEDATVERLSEELNRLVSDRPLLEKMALLAQRAGRPHAADVIAHDLLRLASLDRWFPSAPPTGGENSLYQACREVA